MQDLKTQKQINPYTQEEPVSLTGRQSGSQVDVLDDFVVNDALAKEINTQAWHVPFHNYAGPGTHVTRQIMLTRTAPVSAFDRAAMIHDIEYVKPGSQWQADNNMWLNSVRETPYLLPLHNMVRAVFAIKDIVGYKQNTNQQLYNTLKNEALTNMDLGTMTFSDNEFGNWGL